jgi:hypothetical protein
VADTADDKNAPPSWTGVLAVLDVPDRFFGRRLRLPAGPDQEPDHLPLPLPVWMNISPRTPADAAKATAGTVPHQVGSILRLWRDGQLIRACGELSAQAGPAARVALRWLSMGHRLGMNVEFDHVGRLDTPPHSPGERIVFWKIRGVTLVARPPWDEALIWLDSPAYPPPD